MNAPSRKDRAGLVVRAGIGASARVVQYSSLRFSQVVNDRPALIFLRHGSKRLRSSAGDWTITDGEAIAIAAGQTFDIDNRLSAGGQYEARWLVWDPALIAHFAQGQEQAHEQEQAHPPLAGAAPLGKLDGPFAAAFERALDAIGDPDAVPDAVAAHRLAEVLVWLALRGVHVRAEQDPSLSGRVRRLLETALAQAWTIALAARRFAMSEATFRRRLAAEGNSFGELLADTRMSFAMVLLQSTEHPIGRIALDVGYASASRFAIRFRARFGFAPTAIRGHHRGAGGPVDWG